MKYSAARIAGNVLVFLCFSLVTAGCALSPQTINIKPDIEVQGGVGRSQSISLEVADGRASPILGQRGGVYEETSHISTAENMTTTLRNSLVNALRKQGYSVVEQGADTHLKVEINSMTYASYKEKLLHKVEIGMDVRAVATRDGKEFTGDYRTSRKKDYVTLPGIEENEKIVNETLAGVLKSMLSDDDLIMFIRQ